MTPILVITVDSAITRLNIEIFLKFRVIEKHAFRVIAKF